MAGTVSARQWRYRARQAFRGQPARDVAVEARKQERDGLVHNGAYARLVTWESRAQEARRLAALFADGQQLEGRLLPLLLDEDDTAVSTAAAEPLLEQRTVQGLRLFVRAFGQAEEDTRNKLGDCLYDEPTLWEWVRETLTSVRNGEPEVEQGAVVLRRHMDGQAKSQRRNW